ncbi:MAG: sodium-dependent bicarbonate transport family permease [Gammaproteobacteria bacterium]|nr:sodium-dependent bicarbonate transport family permease [Gammaproteobacteria bacterium]
MVDVIVWFFLLGFCARLGKSDLRLPEPLYEALSVYLLLAIGLKGGVEISRQPIATLLPEALAIVLFGFAIPFVLYPVLRALRLAVADSAALAAHYGSVSVVTFAIVVTELARRGIAHEPQAPLWVALLEAPGLVAGILLARWLLRAETSYQANWGTILHDMLFGKSVLLLLGGIVIGAVAGDSGLAPINAVFVEPFKGVLAIFLLELGLVAGGRVLEIRRRAPVLLLVGIGFPPLLALAGALLGRVLDLSIGGVAILATLAASASYIAAPAAMRQAVPQADAALSVTAALGITFPFNVVLGIPLYIELAHYLAH